MRIELNQVGKRYGQVRALAGVTLEVPSGARVALIGPNGSGKTTLTRALMGVIAHEGEIRLDGVPAKLSRERLAQRLAYVPQVAPQLASSVSELVGSVARLRDLDVGAVHALMRALDLDPAELQKGLDPAAAPVSSFTIGIDDLEVMREKVREAAGYPILKIKVGTAHDHQILRMIREEAPEKVLRVDANTAWTAKEAIRRIPMLEEFGVEFVEQPLPPEDLEGLRLVRKRSRLPIVADESCEVAADVARLAGAVDGVNIKLAKCGSLREAVRIVHAARAHGMSVMIGCMVESTLGIAAALQLAPLVDYVDLDGAALLASDPFTGPGMDSDGRLRFNDAPGLGVTRNG